MEASDKSIEKQEYIVHNKYAKKKTLLIILGSIAVIIIIAIMLFFLEPFDFIKYQKGVYYESDMQLARANTYYLQIPYYKDANERQKLIQNELNYIMATQYFNDKNYAKALEAFAGLGEYKDSKAQSQESLYQKANALLVEKEYDKAIEAFAVLGEYKDSKTQSQECRYQMASVLFDEKEYIEASEIFMELEGYKDSAEKNMESKYQLGMNYKNNKDYTNMLYSLWACGDYKDAKDVTGAYLLEKNQQTIAADSYFTVGVKDDGTAVYVGSGFLNGKVNLDDWNDIVSIDANGSIVGIRSDGTVLLGRPEKFPNEISALFMSIKDWKDIVAITIGSGHVVGLKSDGTVVAAGHNDAYYFETFDSEPIIEESGQCNVDDWTNVISISAGGNYTVGLKADGTVVSTGSDKDMHGKVTGQCDVEEWQDIVAISTGNSHTVGLKSDGTVVAMGANDAVIGFEDNKPVYGYSGKCDVEDWTDIVAINAFSDHTYGIKSDGTIVAAGANKNWPKNEFLSWRNIKTIEAGGIHVVGVLENGKIVATGLNEQGQCNIRNEKNILIPDKTFE